MLAGMDSPDPWLDADERRCWLAFLRVHRRLDERLNRGLKERDGLSHSDYDVLAVLSHQSDHRMRMCDLAATVLISPSRLTHQVKRMEADGLVRRRSTRGVRGTYAELTDRGLALLRRAAPAYVADVRARFVDQLGADGVRALGALLEPIENALCSEPDTGDCPIPNDSAIPNEDPDAAP